MFAELGIVLPPITVALFAVVTFLLNYWYIFFLLFTGGGALAVGLVLFGATWGSAFRRRFPALASMADEACGRLPVVGRIILQASYSQFARASGGLIQAGMPLEDAVGAALEIDFNHLAKSRLKEAHGKMLDGMPFGEALRSISAPAELCWFADAGEGSEHMGSYIVRAADLYQSGVASAVGEMSKAAEPLVTVPMGLVVGWIALAMWSPLIKVMSAM
jgi:type IV pilus assembly protein PilC